MNIVTSTTKESIKKNDSEKLKQEIKERNKELGLKEIVPLKNQDELRQIDDLEKNSHQIQDQMAAKDEERLLIKKKKLQQRRENNTMSEDRLHKMREAREKAAYEARRIIL